MADIHNITLARWNNGDSKPSSYSVEECLEVALQRVRDGSISAAHVVVCFALSDTNLHSSFMQAGSFNSYAQLGLLDAARMLMQGGD